MDTRKVLTPLNFRAQNAKNLNFRTDGLTYTTCSSDPRSCPDQICDSLEQISSAICPQDCMPKENILMGGFHMQNELHGLGFGKVKRPDMICTCQGQSCSCIHQNLSHSVVEEDESKKGKLSSSLLLHPESNLAIVLTFAAFI